MQKMYARYDESTLSKQTLQDHVEGVSERITKYSGKKLCNAAKLIGMLHDCGKFSDLWQRYFLKSIGEDGRLQVASYTEKVPHSTHGARFILELHDEYSHEIKNHLSGDAFNIECVFNDVTADLLRYAILAHHGMFDAMTPNGIFNLDNRAKPTEDKTREIFNECKIKIFSEYPDTEFFLTYKNAVREVKDLMWPVCIQTEFDIGFFARMMLSMIIDADWSDAAAFPDKHTEYENALERFSWDSFLERIEDKSRAFKQINDIDSLRMTISEECKNAASRGGGIYKLDVPTGGGKTISAMRFALNHAKLHSKSRIIYVAPFISILEQNAKAYREILTGTAEENKYITSHYTDVVQIPSDGVSAECLDIEADVSRITKAGTDNWSSPVIFTTMVQLLLTLVSAKKQSVRRTHNLANSVLIIDEYQALPIKSLSVFNRAINALSRYFNVTVVLCTATQPPLKDAITSATKRTKVQKINFSHSPDLVKDYGNISAFKRVELIDARKNKGKGGAAYGLEELTDFVSDKMNSLDSLLVILNTRNAVRNLYINLLKKKNSDSVKIYMLSNNMCPAHRNEIIDRVKEELRSGIRILLVSTSLIEAGVDISFAGVIRSLAGLDVIVQSAGRCNRNGEMKIGKVWIVEVSEDVENISKLKSLKIAQDSLRPLLDHFHDEPEKYDYSIMSKSMLERYFREYYEGIGDQTCYPLERYTNLNDLLAENEGAVKLYKYKSSNLQCIRARVKQSFYTAGKEYKPIDNEPISLLVPYGAGKNIIKDLNSDKFRYGISMEGRRNILNTAGYFSVNVFNNVFEWLKEKGGVFEISWGDKGEIIYVLRDEFYSEEGLCQFDMKEGEKNASVSRSADIF